MTSIAFIGTGRVGATLAIALHRAGMPVQHVASRSAASAAALASRLPGCRAVPVSDAARADLVFLTVPDDSIAAVADALPWRAGQHVVHASGATEVAALRAAADAGALTGGFHPLQIFSDPDTALGLLAGSSVAIEGPPPLEAQLHQLAAALGMHPIRLPPGARALYHGGAGFAASFLLSMLHEATRVWRAFGVSEADALRALLPMAQGTLTAAARKGLAQAIAGPASRGDFGVIARHLQALEQLGAPHAAFYRQMSRRQLDLLQSSGRLNESQCAQLRQLLAEA